MKYYHLNQDTDESHIKPIVAKVSTKLEKIACRMCKLVKEHKKLDKMLIQEFAKCNDITEDEASDLLCQYDFMVDTTQYSCGPVFGQIDLDTYKKLKSIQQNNELSVRCRPEGYICDVIGPDGEYRETCFGCPYLEKTNEII